MGRVQSLPSAGREAAEARAAAASRVVRLADIVASVLVLVLAGPLIAVLAVAVRLSSNGPVLHRRPAMTADGRRVELLSFRCVLDGGGTEAHQRIRAVVGGADRQPLTGPGRIIRRLRLERLPRLVNVAAGHVSLFG